MSPVNDNICVFPGSCLPGRCIAAETAASPNFSIFSSWKRCELALVPLAPHCPPELTLLRGLPDEWTEPPDRQPSAPRHLPRGVHIIAVAAWICAAWVALGTAAWVLHWIICN